MNKFESPSKAVLYRATLDKTMLIFMYELQDLFLKSVGQELGKKLQAAV